MIEALERYIGTSRWFGGKGRGFKVGDLHRLAWLTPPNGAAPGGPRVRIELAEVWYDEPAPDSGKAAVETYQLPLAYYEQPQERVEHALIGQWEDDDLGPVFVYDALHDREATALFLEAFEHRQDQHGLLFHRLPGHDLDMDVHSTLLSAEQSNSSLAFGEDSLMKVFRKVTPGRNPDIEVHEALTQAGSEHVAALYGWLEATQEATGREHDDPVQLAMLQQFLRTASDGWDLALASVRDLFAEADLHADEVGGDFAAESHRLGVATAEVHEALSDQFPTETWDAEQVTALATAMRDRLEAALTIVPDLETHAGALREAFEAVAAITGPVVVQRVHGDLHLGQTLRTVRGWKIVDFEGEPAKPLHERIRPDSRWRDVAGMLRSLDYAAHAVEADVEEGAQIAYRALEWVVRNQSAFLEGYAEGRGVTDGLALSADEETLLAAYVLDKAIYETVYETRNRPDWLGIPMRAVQRLVGPQGSPETTEVFER